MFEGPSLEIIKEDQRPLLITGATGTLGEAFRRMCELRALNYRLVCRADMDIADPGSVRAMLQAANPWGVINTAGYVRVDEAENDAPRCFRENTEGPTCLAAACAERELPLLNFSSDLVFDGTASRPYVESDLTNPLNVYGRSKTEMEKQVKRVWPGALIVRTSAFFGPWDEYNFVTCTLRSLQNGLPVSADSSLVSPTYLPDLVNACLDLLIDGESGLWHLANDGMITWLDLARRLATDATADPELIQPLKLQTRAVRPHLSALGSERGMLLPKFDDALTRYASDRKAFLNESTDAPADLRIVRTTSAFHIDEQRSYDRFADPQRAG
jgi:dTDP-4-dehydrorhamnose reductase